jgi:hypothetical protein
VVQGGVPGNLIFEFFRKSIEKIQVLLKTDKNNRCFNEDRYTFVIISRPVILRMKNVSDKIVEKITHFIFNKSFFPKIVPFMRYGRPQMTIMRVRIACWIPKANTHF